MKPYVPAGETFHSYYKPDDSKYEWMITYEEIPTSGGFYTRYYLYRIKHNGKMKCGRKRWVAIFRDNMVRSV